MQFSYTSLACGVLLLLLVLPSCGRIGFGSSAVVGEDAAPDTSLTADGGDASPDAVGDELCNERDDDGDGLVDEGFDLTSLRDHCGACGAACTYANAIGRCNDSMCSLGACDEGFDDCDGVADNGCEHDVGSDPANCGRCGRACASGVECREGTCATDVVFLAAGADSTCGLTADGDVYCWGDNSSGQLGDGTTTDRLTPVRALVGGAVRVSVGTNHTCVADASGAACFGDNAFGQLGDGTTTSSPTPVRVTLPAGGISVAAGRGHSCVALNDGTAHCWGDNASGQLGDGTTTSRSTPAPVPGLVEVRSVSAGHSHTCALHGAGNVSCWGDNTSGQLGDGTTTSSLIPVSTALEGQKHIDMGAFHSCSHGSAWCWGQNDEGQLSDGSLENRPSPTTVMVESHTDVTAGDAHSCVVTGSSRLHCAGRNAEGQLGDGTTTNAPVAVEAISITRVRDAAAGGAHTCAVNRFGAVRCWGANGSGQLGDGTMTSRLTASRVTGLP